MSAYGGEFDEVLATLRRECPPSVPVIVRTCPSGTIRSDCGEPYHADCLDYFTEGKLSYFRLRVERGLRIKQAVDCLIHEWAHALHREENPNARLDHGGRWGELYAKCYQAVFGKH